MGLDRILATAGVLLALPGFLLLFLGDGPAAAGVVVLGGVAFVGLLYARNLPPFTMKSVKHALTFDKAGKGEFATIRKTYHARANHRHLSVFAHKNIAAEGRIENFRWNDIPLSDVRVVLGDHQVDIRLDPPPGQYAQFTGSLSYDLRDSFPATEEELMYVVDHPTASIDFCITLPDSRPCKDARAKRSRGAATSEVPGLKVAGFKIELSIAHPKVGETYSIIWNW